MDFSLKMIEEVGMCGQMDTAHDIITSGPCLESPIIDDSIEVDDSSLAASVNKQLGGLQNVNTRTCHTPQSKVSTPKIVSPAAYETFDGLVSGKRNGIDFIQDVFLQRQNN